MKLTRDRSTPRSSPTRVARGQSPAARRAARRRRRSVIALVTLVALIGLSLGALTVRVRKVEIVGVTASDAGHLREVLSRCLGAQMYLIDGDSLAEDLQTDPWLRSARLLRWPTGTLEIRLTEANPAFVLANGGAAVSLDGMLLPPRPGIDLNDLPRLVMQRPSGDRLSKGAAEAVRRLCSSLDRAPWTWPSGLRQVELEEGGNVVLTTGRGVEVVLGRERWASRLQALSAAAPMLRPGPGDRLDLRFERQVVLSPAGGRDVRIGG